MIAIAYAKEREETEKNAGYPSKMNDKGLIAVKPTI